MNIFDRVAPNLPLTDLSRSTDENLFAFGVVSNIMMPITILLIVYLIYYLVTGKKLFEDSNNKQKRNKKQVAAGNEEFATELIIIR